MKINNLTRKPNAGAYKGRCTGKSTALAFIYISEALANPNKRISIRDHHGTREADRCLARDIRRIVATLDLKAMEFTEGSVRFNLYSESDEYIELNGHIYKKVGEFK